jgi:hypothetical protein
MSWNYRVLKHKDNDEVPYYQVHEVFYNEDGSIMACSEHQCSPFGETVEELKLDFELMAGALDKPIIPYAEI